MSNFSPRRLGIGAALLALGALGCPTRSPIPGELLGRFKFQATTLDGGCSFEELPADGGFSFTGTFSVVDGGPEAYLTTVDSSRRGDFDGQRFESTYPPLIEPGVARTFEIGPDAGPCGNEFLVHETVRLALLTADQFAALSGGCGPDGGAEAALDAGGPPPTRGPNGLDAVRACGLLVDEVRPADAACTFAPCSITFTLDGEPQR